MVEPLPIAKQEVSILLNAIGGVGIEDDYRPRWWEQRFAAKAKVSQ